MASDSLQNFLKAQQDLVENVRKQMESAARREAPSPDALLADRERFTEQIRARVSSLKTARTKAIDRYDTEIRRQEELLSRLEAGIQQEREQLAKAGAEGEKPKAPSPTEANGEAKEKKPKASPTAEANVEAKVVRLASGARQVTGRVTDAADAPLPGLHVELFEKGGDKSARSATTDEEGRFTFMDVSAGALTVKVRIGDRVIEKKVSSR